VRRPRLRHRYRVFMAAISRDLAVAVPRMIWEIRDRSGRGRIAGTCTVGRLSFWCEEITGDHSGIAP
jgi:hypothetical protein